MPGVSIHRPPSGDEQLAARRRVAAALVVADRSGRAACVAEQRVEQRRLADARAAEQHRGRAGPGERADRVEPGAGDVETPSTGAAARALRSCASIGAGIGDEIDLRQHEHRRDAAVAQQRRGSDRGARATDRCSPTSSRCRRRRSRRAAAARVASPAALRTRRPRRGRMCADHAGAFAGERVGPSARRAPSRRPSAARACRAARLIRAAGQLDPARRRRRSSRDTRRDARRRCAPATSAPSGSTARRASSQSLSQPTRCEHQIDSSRVAEQVEREHLAARLDALEQRAQLGAAQRRSRISSSVSHAAPSDSSSAVVFGARVIDRRAGEQHAHAHARCRRRVLDAQDAVDPDRHAGLLVAPRGSPPSTSDSPGSTRPPGIDQRRTVLALLRQQKAVPSPHDDEREVPGRDRRAAHRGRL